jgi:hypothetical protein
MNWKLTIDISKPWNKYPQDTLKDSSRFQEVKKEIVAILKKYKPAIISTLGEEYLTPYEELISELSKTRTLDTFNYYWNRFYEFADNTKIWIKTYK